MKIDVRQQTEFVVTLTMDKDEAGSLATLLYQATSDLIPNHKQLEVANGLIAALSCRNERVK